MRRVRVGVRVTSTANLTTSYATRIVPLAAIHVVGDFLAPPISCLLADRTRVAALHAREATGTQHLVLGAQRMQWQVLLR